METIQHRLQQFDPGVVWLDANNVITAMNSVAAETLGDGTGTLIGEEVLQVHPEKSREKVKFLLDRASCPAASPLPVAMMINLPERVLLIKVVKMSVSANSKVGSCMIFYDMTDLAAAPAAEPNQEVDTAGQLQLVKLPVYKNKQVLLIDLESVACIKAEGHYSTLYSEGETFLCNLSLSALEGRIKPPHFIRVHRSYLVNLRFAKAFDKVDEQCCLVIDYQAGLRIPVSRSHMGPLKEMLGIA